MEVRGERSRYVFRVKEAADGTPWIQLEPSGKEITFLEHALFGFNLQPGTNLAQAEKIADFLNNSLTDVGVTLFPEHPMFNLLPSR